MLELSRPLREEVSLHKCQDVLRKLHVVQGSEPGLSSAVSRVLERIAFVCGDFIIRAGEEAEAMYFVMQGEVEVLSAPRRLDDGTTDESSVTRITKLASGSFFGEMALLSSAGRSVASIAATQARHACRRRAHSPLPMRPPSPSTHCCRSRTRRLSLTAAGAHCSGGTRRSVPRALAARQARGRPSRTRPHRPRQDCVTYRLSKRAYEDTVATYPSFKLYLESVAKLRLTSMSKDDRLSRKVRRMRGSDGWCARDPQSVRWQRWRGTRTPKYPRSSRSHRTLIWNGPRAPQSSMPGMPGHYAAVSGHAATVSSTKESSLARFGNRMKQGMADAAAKIKKKG